MIRQHWFSKGLVSSGNKPLAGALLTQSCVHEELMIRFDLFSWYPDGFSIDFIDQMTPFEMSGEASQILATLEKLRIDIYISF